ncbi:MAG TPA: glycosyltransferase [Planctomycetota bacterium]|nr:glycosyltransferase [Planctomycetota bacterium]
MRHSAVVPMISVLLTTYNRSGVLMETLEAMCAVDATGLEVEFVVVDNNSTDDTQEVLRHYADRLPLVALFESRQGKNHAMKRALTHAHGGLLVFTDDDVTPVPGWLRAYVSAQTRWVQNVAFCGPVVSRPPESADPLISQVVIGTVGVAHMDPACPEGPLPVDLDAKGPNFMLTRSAFEQFGLFVDPLLGPTADRPRVAGTEASLFEQLQAAGQHPIFVPEARVVHRTPPEFWTLANLERRAIGQGRGSAHIRRIDRRCPRILGIPWFKFRTLTWALLREVACGGLGMRVRRHRMRLRRIGCQAAIAEYYRMYRAGTSPPQR